LQTCAIEHKDSARRLLKKEIFSESGLEPIGTAVRERIHGRADDRGAAKTT
jgi:hypothetical protein